MIRSALRRARAHSHAVISRGDGRGIDMIGYEVRQYWIAWIRIAGAQHSCELQRNVTVQP